MNSWAYDNEPKSVKSRSQITINYRTSNSILFQTTNNKGKTENESEGEYWDLSRNLQIFKSSMWRWLPAKWRTPPVPVVDGSRLGEFGVWAAAGRQAAASRAWHWRWLLCSVCWTAWSLDWLAACVWHRSGWWTAWRWVWEAGWGCGGWTGCSDWAVGCGRVSRIRGWGWAAQWRHWVFSPKLGQKKKIRTRAPKLARFEPAMREDALSSFTPPLPLEQSCFAVLSPHKLYIYVFLFF